MQGTAASLWPFAFLLFTHTYVWVVAENIFENSVKMLLPRLTKVPGWLKAVPSGLGDPCCSNIVHFILPVHIYIAREEIIDNVQQSSCLCCMFCQKCGLQKKITPHPFYVNGNSRCKRAQILMMYWKENLLLCPMCPCKHSFFFFFVTALWMLTEDDHSRGKLCCREKHCNVLSVNLPTPMTLPSWGVQAMITLQTRISPRCIFPQLISTTRHDLSIIVLNFNLTVAPKLEHHVWLTFLPREPHEANQDSSWSTVAEQVY